MRLITVITLIAAAVLLGAGAAQAQTPIEIPPDWGFTAAVYYEAATDTSNRVVTVNNRFSLTASWAESLRNGKTYFPSVGIEITINQGAFRPNSITFRSNSKAAPRPHKEWPPEATCAGDSNAQWWTMPIGVVLDSSWEDGGYSYWRYKSQWSTAGPLRNMAQFSFRIPMRGCHNSTNPKSYTLDWEIYAVNDQSLLNAAFTAEPVSGPAPLAVTITDTSTPPGDIKFWRWDMGNGDVKVIERKPGVDPGYSFTYIYAVPGEYIITLKASNSSGESDSHTIQITVEAPFDLIRPLRSDEVADWGIWDYASLMKTDYFSGLFDGYLGVYSPDEDGRYWTAATAKDPSWYLFPGNDRLRYKYLQDYFTVNFFSNRSDAGVYNTVSGQVVGIIDFETHYHCNAVVMPYNHIGPAMESIDAFLKKCIIRVPPPVTSDSSDQFYVVDSTGGALVRVRGFDGAFYDYVLRNPTVEVGTRVDPGCVLGETLPLNTLSTLEVSALAVDLAGPGAELTPVSYPTGNGYGSVTKRFDVESELLLPYITNYPTGISPCGDLLGSECVSRNNRFREASGQWVAYGAVRWLSPAGLILGPGATIEQQLFLDASTTYTVSLKARPDTGAGAASLTIQLGTTTETVPVNDADFAYTRTDLFEADAGLAYTYRITNPSQSAVVLNTQCISTTDIDLSRGPCYVVNSTFDYGTASWTATGSVSAVEGALNLADEATISQDVSLEPATYTLTVKLRYWRETTVPPGAQPRIEYSLADNNFVNIPYNDSIAYIPSLAGSLDSVPMIATIEVTEPVTGPLVLRIDLGDTPPSELLGITVLEVCLAGAPDPYQPGPFEPVCRVVTPPSDNSVGSWTQWLWANQDEFFQCQLMIILRRIYNVTDDIKQLIGWQARYWMSVATMQANWLGVSLLPWLAGYLSNAAGGQVVTSGGASFWDVLLALIQYVLGPIMEIIMMAANLLFSVIGSAIDLAVAMIAEGLALIRLIDDLFKGVVSAFNNAQPRLIPGMPMCVTQGPRSSPVCIAYWVMENTIFAGPGAVVIPLMITILTVHLALWVIGEVRGALIQTGKAI